VEECRWTGSEIIYPTHQDDQYQQDYNEKAGGGRRREVHKGNEGQKLNILQ
jgi:hypothetical protein